MQTLQVVFANDYNKGLFELGGIVETSGAIPALQQADVTATELLHRHLSEDAGKAY